MPAQDDNNPLSPETQQLIENGEKRAKRWFQGFTDFALQGNILEIAFGLIIAAAFTALVNSFINDIFLPPLSIILPLNANLDQKFAILQAGPNYNETIGGYNTISQALDDGCVVLAYGKFINKTVNFFALGFSLYLLASLYQWLSHDQIIKHTERCRYCRKQVSAKAQRCVNCTSWLDGREDKIAETG